MDDRSLGTLACLVIDDMLLGSGYVGLHRPALGLPPDGDEP
ncbi:hypothetical protein RKD29_007623 [Streptomyces tendae]